MPHDQHPNDGLEFFFFFCGKIAEKRLKQKDMRIVISLSFDY